MLEKGLYRSAALFLLPIVGMRVLSGIGHVKGCCETASGFGHGRTLGNHLFRRARSRLGGRRRVIHAALDFVGHFAGSFLELIDALAQTLCKFRNPLGAKQNEDDHQY